MTIRKASCSCGKLELTCAGDPVRVSMCHCLECQKRTGSIFGTQARYGRSQVTVEGKSSEYVRVGDEGTRITLHFCPICGSTVFWRMEGMDQFVAVAVGAFADPNFPTPSFSVYGARRHGWAVMPGLEVEEWD